jgi:hypothetical protein
MTTGQIIAATARLWLRHGSPWMARARRELTAFSPPMVELGLRELFADIAANVEELERREASRVTNHQSRITLCHILSGNLPNPGIVSIVVGLLSGARNVVKLAAGDTGPALFVESLAAVDAKLSRRVKLTRDREAYRGADVVVAYGNDETMATLRRRCRQDAAAAFFGFGHRTSIGLINLRNLSSRTTHDALRSAARDASVWDQQGCMSPQCFYVRGDATAFAEVLAGEMKTFNRHWPRAKLVFGDAAAIARARNEWSFRGRVWASKDSTHWTVVLDEHSDWSPSPLNRFVFVRPMELIETRDSKLVIRDSGAKRRAASYESPVTNHGLPPLSTVGFAGFSPTEAVAMARADRYCSVGEMQRPSLLLTNGSRPRVGDLIL